MESIKLAAIIHSVRVDKEGESKLTLSIPQSELDKVLALGKATERLLEVRFKIQDD